jgi:putative endonuclease
MINTEIIHFLDKHMAFYCYILECSDGSYYTGWSTDPERRLREHNSGSGARYTRSRRPVRLVYLEELPDKSAALKRERAIKALPRPKKLKLVSSQFIEES